VGKRKNTRTSTDRLNKSKRENQKLRTLASRQRRNIKHLVALIQQARRAIRDADVLRTAALLEANIKYPPSCACECNHEWTHKYVDICKHCGEIYNG
jgi:hypothetical protein